MEKRNKTTIILGSIIVVLVVILGYGFYTGVRVKAEINNLNSQINQLTGEKDGLTSQLSALQKNYDLLIKDVAQIYKTCMKENACKGRYPNISWQCNNVGDEADNPSHTCICDSSCNLIATQISS